jgi:hypothetical protein
MLPPTHNIALAMAEPVDIIDVAAHVTDNWTKIDNWIGTANAIGIVNPIASGAGISAYSLGWTMFYIDPATMANDTNWSIGYNAPAAVVVNMKQTASVMTQWWYRIQSGAEEVYCRTFGPTGSPNPWQRLSGQGVLIVNANNAVSLPDSTWGKNLSMGTELIHGYNLNFAGGAVVPREPGVYQFDLTVNWLGQAQASNQTFIGIGLNSDSAPTGYFKSSSQNNGTVDFTQTATFLRSCNTNDQVIMWLWQTSASAAAKSYSYRRMSIRKVSENF